MSIKLQRRILTLFIALVWLINGLCYKVLNLVPRHEQIVASILSDEYSRLLTILIGVAEIVMVIWILTNFKSRWSATAQIVIVLVMNILELMLVPDLLLWGKMNFVFAILFVGTVYYHEFVLKEKLNPQLT